MKSKVIIGLSGGVDSAVSALLLKQQGYDVEGVFMQNWEVENDDPHCTGEQDLSDAKAVADHLDIPFHTVNFSRTYWDHVFQHCLDEYAAGRTPNPDIGCNKEIKFKVFLDYALEMGAGFLATGHYAQKRQQSGLFELLRGADTNKDQSYFLYTLTQHALSHACFPVGHLTKPEVRALAKAEGLPIANKKDSTGICFIGERKFSTFLKEFLLAQPGEMVTEKGEVLGRHDGLMFYTLGQRKGLQIGGQRGKAEAPWFVIDKNLRENKLIVAQGHHHPKLYQTRLTCTDCHWIACAPPSSERTLTAKIRYRQQDAPCTLRWRSDGILEVEFETPQWAITPGQSIVFYDQAICLGGGIITGAPGDADER